MRRLRFMVREGIRALSRAGLAGWLAVLALAALAAFGTAIYGARQALQAEQQRLLARFEIEVFLKPGLEARLNDLAARVKKRDGVVEVTEVTKEQAAERFSERYGGELFDLLEENPLPASVIVRYDPGHVTPDWIAREASELKKLPDVDDVSYEGELLTQLQAISGKIDFWLLVAALAVTLIALFLTFQTVRVAVRSGRSWARAVRLMGGTNTQVRQPFFVAGSLAGLVGGVVGAGAVTFLQVLLAQSGLVPFPRYEISGAAVILTVLIGALGAWAAAPRFSRRGRAT